MDTVLVKIKQGYLLGSAEVPFDTRSFYSFKGVPYAKPPIGPLRFKAPQPPDPWDGTREAFEEGPVAPQFDDTLNATVGDEDCLYLNVFTPKSPNEKLFLPVMVWIHGGGYCIGSGNSNFYGPNRLMEEDVVLVTFNHRLGALGFLSTGDEVVPGNNGLKDQIMVLRWVQENITKFGGDPNNVTVFGVSAGGSSVHHLLLSPMCSGLFHRAIIQSGCGINPWSFKDVETSRKIAFKFGEALGCKTACSKDLLKHLMTVSTKNLVEAAFDTMTEDEKHPFPMIFAPTSEPFVAHGEEAFLPDTPLNLMTQGRVQKVPLIMGVTVQEIMFAVADAVKCPSWYESLNENFDPIITTNFSIKDTNKIKELGSKVKQFYFGNKKICKDTWQEYVNLYSDLWINIGMTTTLKKLLAISSLPIYYYNFTYDGKLGYNKIFYGAACLPGACHGDENGYLFYMQYHSNIDLDYEEETRITMERMIKMWTNFAKTGNPTPRTDDLLNVQWSPASKSELKYLKIDKELSMQNNLLERRMLFWEKMYKEYELQ